MFQGFTDATVDFMWGIRFNNERGWFMEHKQVYQDALLQPVKDLGAEVYDAMHEMLPDEPLMLKVSRIYRDARRLFGRGPYKDHLWWCIRTGDKDWTGRPTFWFEIAPEYYSFGLGFWAPAPALMDAYRKRIDSHPEELLALARQLEKDGVFSVQGPEYARSRGEVCEELRSWYQKKSLSVGWEGPLDERIYSPQLAQDIIAGFRSLLPLYRYFSAIHASVPTEQLEKNRDR